MFGVVLWADAGDRNAVIWCEDHGNLAYYTAPEEQAEQTLLDDVSLDAGDLIQFDIREDPDCRRARNLRRVNAGFAPTLASELRGRNTVEANCNNVVRFPRRQC